MSSWLRSCCALALAATTGVGCEAIVHYPTDRAKDLIDVVGFDLYWGQGIIAHAQMTKVAQVGVGGFDGDIVKYHRRAFGHVEEMRAEAGLPFYYFTVYDRQALGGSESFLAQHRQLTGLGKVHYNLTDPNDRGFYEVGVDVVAFLGAGVDIDVFQFVDFVTGWIGLDMGRDDYRHRESPPVAHPRYEAVGESPISGEA